jgi:hypothetical protein
MSDEVLRGGCACGAVRFEVDAPPLGAGWCHCTRCRRRTGAHASPQARVASGSLRFTTGREAITEWTPPGGGFVKAFCSACGSHLYGRSPDGWDVVGVRLGAFDDDPGVRPEFHQHVATAAPWQPLPDDGLPRFPAGRPPS